MAQNISFFDKKAKSGIIFCILIECGSLGEMAEWSKAHVSKTCRGESLSGVRISLSPPTTIEAEL